MREIAVIGAGGFIGTSLVESLVLDGKDAVTAVVRAYRNFAGLCRFGPSVSIRIADAEDGPALTRAIQGAAVVVNVTTGPPAGIVRSTRAIHEACLAANVSRLIHLSSAVIYGDVDSPHLDDDSPPVARHWMPYARAKADSEVWLRQRLRNACLETAVLRPGIVWGVRSPHTINMAHSLLRKTSFLVEQGTGVFNGIYISNLLACIRECIDHPTPITGFYNVADAELITWRDFYSALAPWLEFDVAQMPNISGERFPWSKAAVLDYVQNMPFVNDLYHRVKMRVPDWFKSKIKSHLTGHYDYERVARHSAPTPSVDREMWHLQRVKNKLPTTKFNSYFNHHPPVGFSDGILHTMRWLACLGYVTRHQGLSMPA